MDGTEVHDLVIAIYSLTVAILAYLLKWGFGLFFGHYREKSKQSDQTRVDVQRLEWRDMALEEKIDEIKIGVKALHKDMSRLLRAVELLAGEKWPEIARKIKDGEIKHE